MEVALGEGMGEPLTMWRADGESRWLVAHTRSRAEKKLAGSLVGRGIRHFLPVYRSSRAHGNRRRVVEMPIFPGYVFVFGPAEVRGEVLATGAVARVIDVADQEGLESELVSLARSIDAGAAFDPYPYLVEGARVRVRAGPLMGVEGMVDARGDRDRLILLVRILGRATSIEIDSDLLEVVG